MSLCYQPCRSGLGYQSRVWAGVQGGAASDPKFFEKVRSMLSAIPTAAKHTRSILHMNIRSHIILCSHSYRFCLYIFLVQTKGPLLWGCRWRTPARMKMVTPTNVMHHDISSLGAPTDFRVHELQMWTCCCSCCCLQLHHQLRTERRRA